MSAFCPNFSNKQVKQEFDDLTNAVGENAAYYLWNKHEGDYELASQEAALITQWNSDQLFEVIDQTELGKVFNDFMKRISFDVQLDASLTKPVIDVANKMFQIGETNDKTLAQSMAVLGWGLLDKYTQREIVKHYGKAKLLGGDITDNILYDLQKSIEKGVATNFEQSWFDKIMSKLAELIGKIVHNRVSYFNSLDKLAKSIAKNYDGYFDTLIKEGFEQKHITLADIHSTEVGKVYDILTSDKYGGTLGGSAAIRLQGTLYRQVEEDFHDLDFVMPYSKFSWNLHEAIGRFYDNKRANSSVMGWKDASIQAKEQLMKEADTIFRRSELFQELSENYESVGLKNVFYTPKNGICFTFTVDGFPVDLFFAKDVKPIVINDIKVSHFSGSFAAKAIMRRPKDMRDIINFKKFKDTSESLYYNAMYDGTDSIYAMSDDSFKLITRYPVQDDYTADVLLTRMFDSGDFFNTEEQRKIATQIKNILGSEVEIFFANNVNYEAKYEVYKGKPSITINLSALRNLNTYDFGHVILHELLHHFTVEAYRNDSAFRARIDAIYNDIVKKIPAEQRKNLLYYGLKDPEEFIAELYTNAAFREMVVKHRNRKGWRRLLSATLNKLGFKHKASEVLNGKVNQEIGGLIKEIGIIINNFYSNPLNNRLGDAVKYFDDSNSEYDSVKQHAEELIVKAKTGLNSRLQSLKRNKDATPAQIATIQSQLDRYEAMLKKGETQSVIVDFIKQTSVAYKSTLDTVRRAYIDDETITNEQIWAMKGDFIDFYGPMIRDIEKYLGTTGYFDNLSEEQIRALKRRIYLTKMVHAEIDGKWSEIIKKKTIKLLTELADEYNVPSETIESYINDELNNTDKDIWLYGRYLQSTKSMDDIAIRMMHRLMVDINNEVGRYANDVAQKLIRTVDPKYSWIHFYEVDNTGRKTGNLVRRLNYGQFKQDMSKFLSELDVKYGVEDQNYKLLDDDKYLEYSREKEQWLSEHCERKFLSDYYKAYAELPLAAKELLKHFNKEITLITDTQVAADGVHLELLDDEQYAKLQALYKAKANLSNLYYEDGTEKLGEDREIAIAIKKFNEITKGGIKSKELTQQEIIDIIAEKRATLTSDLFQKWVDRNVSYTYSDLLQEVLNRLPKKHSEEYERYSRMRSQLLRYGRNTKNPYIRASALTESAKEQILVLDERLYEIAQEEGKDSESARIFQYFTFEPTSEYWQDRKTAENKGKEEFARWYATAHTKYGKVASFYTKMKPIKKDGMIVRLNQMNREMSADSPLFNKDYDFSDPEFYQPKKSMYDNSAAFDEIMKDPKEAEAYNLIVDTLRTANRKINYLDKANDYKLPQISGDFIDHVIRSKDHLKGIARYADDRTSIRKDDEQYALDNFTQRADGTKLDFVPTPYLKRLEHPDTISTNIVGIVAEYARMAENFRLKNQHKGDFMIIEELLKSRIYKKVDEAANTVDNISGEKTVKYAKYHEFLDMQLYGRFKTPIANKRGKKWERITKSSHIAKSWATALNLGWNILSITKSFFQSINKSIVESLAGRYFTADQYFKFLAQQIFMLPKYLWQLGNPKANDFTIALLNHNGISRELQDVVKGLNYDRFTRVVSKSSVWGGWSFADFMIKGPILKSIYANFKYDPQSNKFLSRHQFINKYYPNDRSAGKKAFRQLEHRASNVITSKNGVIVMKKGYEHLNDAFFDKTVQNNIKNIAKYLTNRIDGMLSPEDKTRFMTDSVSSWAFMHKSFFVNNLEDNFAINYQYNPLIEDYIEAKFQSFANPMITVAKNLIITAKNGFKKVSNAVTGSNKSFEDYHEIFFNSVHRYNLSKIAMQIGVVLLVSMLAAIWLHEEGKDSDSAAAQTTIAALEGMVNEEMAEYPSWALMNQFFSGSAAVAPLSNIHNTIQLFNPENWDSDNAYESGAYEDMLPAARIAIQATPGLKGLWESQNVLNKWNYIEQNRTFPASSIFNWVNGEE